MEKVYIVYYSNYEDTVRDCGCDATEIIGVFKNKEDAIKRAKDKIDWTLTDGCYILDEERNDIDRDNMVRFFYNNQENWRDYFEIVVEECEVK